MIAQRELGFNLIKNYVFQVYFASSHYSAISLHCARTYFISLFYNFLYRIFSLISRTFTLMEAISNLNKQLYNLNLQYI